MRSYSVAVASLAIGAPIKWTDNLLAQHALPELNQRGRGVERGLSWPALVRVAIIRELSQELGCTVKAAVRLAAGLLDGAGTSASLDPQRSAGDPAGVAARAGPHLAVTLDRDALERSLTRRLADALETAPRPRRGRPRIRGARRTGAD